MPNGMQFDIVTASLIRMPLEHSDTSSENSLSFPTCCATVLLNIYKRRNKQKLDNPDLR